MALCGIRRVSTTSEKALALNTVDILCTRGFDKVPIVILTSVDILLVLVELDKGA